LHIQADALNFRLDPTRSPEYAGILRIKCDANSGAVCLGSELPEIGQKYPNAQAALVLSAEQAPAVIARENQAQAYVPLILTLMADNNELAKASCDVEATMKPTLEGNSIRGQFRMKK